MAQLPGVFNDTKADEGFTTIPEGWYVAKITKTEIKPTRDNSGLRLLITFKVDEGEYKGRALFLGLNVKNKSETAMAISKRQFNEICDAVGIDEEERVDPSFDTVQMHGIPLKVKVKLVEATAQWPAKNEPVAFASMDSDVGEEDSGDMPF